MADELDEGLPHGLTDDRVRSQNIADGEDGEQHPNSHDLQRLQEHVLPPETRKSLVPDGRQQLLHVWVRHELES